MNTISTEENLRQKNFVAKTFLACYNLFKEIDILGEDYISEFQFVVENDGQSLLLDLTSVILTESLIFDDERRIEVRSAYFDNSIPTIQNLANHKSANTDFINHHLMTNFFKSELLQSFDNYTLGFRFIKKHENEALYYKYYHFVLNELQKLIFMPDYAGILKTESINHKPIHKKVEKTSFKNMLDIWVKSIKHFLIKLIVRK